jgi:catechol 2,3-dioxygenase-like lactoylglutathione lyase family enzyme
MATTFASIRARTLSCPSAMLTEDSLETEKLKIQRNWILSDAVASNSGPNVVTKLPLASFNHVAREVLSIENSKFFYVEILGFSIIPRPPFDSEGYWLYGYGLSLHLVETTVPEERKRVKIQRIQHFSSSLPRVDHIAFITSDISFVKKVLDDARVFYKEDCPKDTGIRQIFLFDPDGNVIEISNCSPEVGQTQCIVNRSESLDHCDVHQYYASKDGFESPSDILDWDGTDMSATDGTEIIYSILHHETDLIQMS